MHTIKIGLTGHPLDTFIALSGRFEIARPPLGTVMSVDGKLSVFDQPVRVMWIDGDAEALKGRTRVIITRTIDAFELLSGEIAWNAGVVRVERGIQFQVLPG